MYNESGIKIRRWLSLVLETLFATVVFSAAVLIARPVFLTPLQAEPEPPLTTSDLLASLDPTTIVGYAPDQQPYLDIMDRVATKLKISLMSGATEYDLNSNLYRTAKVGGRKPVAVMWIIWQEKIQNVWHFSLRSTERARYHTSTDFTAYPNPHLRAGFLAVQLAISEAIIAHSASDAKYEVKLVSMPISPLMQQEDVKKALSGILLCFTIALIPPVLDVQGLVVSETTSRFKASLRMRGVSYGSMYLGWLVYAYLTALPVCFVAAVTLLLIFRWIHIFVALMLLLGYISAMILTALIMAMFHSKTWIARVWSTLFTLLQTYMAELLVHHEYDTMHGAITFLLHLLMPPLGLVHALNHFALLSTGTEQSMETTSSLWYSYGSWCVLIVMYFAFLIILQRTIGQDRAIGGQVTWKSIIFKKVENVNEIRKIENPTGKERDKLQEVDEFVAKAVSFRNVSKSIMNVRVLDNITLDIYRGEFTMLFAERVQERMITTTRDLLTGLTYAEHGTINVLGEVLRPGYNALTEPHMMGYCHRPSFLVDDLTVAEHLTVYTDICLWQESREYIFQYSMLRWRQLLEECALHPVQHEQVATLHAYYCAQLCWAITVLMEPRIVVLSNFSKMDPHYNMVIRDKIMKYKKYLTVIQLCFSSLQLEFADRVFIFDSKVLAFGGTPAYMFFKYGREYRVRMTIRSDANIEDDPMRSLIARAHAAGGTVRAHLGSLLILRVPTTPTDAIAALVKHYKENAAHYGIQSIHISVPDSEEVYRRAMMESRALLFRTNINADLAKNALKNMSEPPKWKRQKSCCINLMQLRHIGWKYFAFHVHYRFYFIITLMSAILTGIFIGLSLSGMLTSNDRDEATSKLLHGEILTVEFVGKPTTLVLRSDLKAPSLSVAHAYVLSEPNATKEKVSKISYTGLMAKESLTEYLVTRAIDSPQLYVSMYAYGLDVKTRSNGLITVNVLYSPLHKDFGAAARSLAKAYTALLRHFTGTLDASIQVTDDPLALDLTPWMILATRPPLLVQFLLILAISHITLIPSMEHGFVRHVQIHAMNFSPIKYWFTLYFWDLVLYWLLVCVMTGVSMLMMYLVAPIKNFQYEELLVVPFVLIIYGFACVPQAYLFSLGPRVALNSMTFIIVNVVFGETTIIAQTFYGEFLAFALLLMRLSPQFNLAYALIKVKQIFLYNTECFIFETQSLCSGKILHKCCKKCGILQECFKKRNYLSMNPGILKETVAMISLAVLFTLILLFVEYDVLGIISTWWTRTQIEPQLVERVQPGAQREKIDVKEKLIQIKEKPKKIVKAERFNTFGEYLLAHNVTIKDQGMYAVHSVSLGVGKGEALAISGLKRHGRLDLVELLGGFRRPEIGYTICMSKWDRNMNPHKYCRAVSLSCDRTPLPPWMTVYDALELLALLRGVPHKHVHKELSNIIHALEIQDEADTLICRMVSKTDRTRLHFAAAIVGCPPVIIVDECTAHQKNSVRRAMYSMLYCLRKRGHAVITSASSVETHLPMTNRLAIILDGTIFDVDAVDELVARYSNQGYTVVLHLKDEVSVEPMFARHFTHFVINDTSEVLVNVQILDQNLDWALIFEKMEDLKKLNHQVYSYIVTAIPIDYIYNSILNNEKGNKQTTDFVSGFRFRRQKQPKIEPSPQRLEDLLPFEQKYDITKLKELPWSVIFHT